MFRTEREKGQEFTTPTAENLAFTIGIRHDHRRISHSITIDLPLALRLLLPTPSTSPLDPTTFTSRLAILITTVLHLTIAVLRLSPTPPSSSPSSPSRTEIRAGGEAIIFQWRRERRKSERETVFDYTITAVGSSLHHRHLYLLFLKSAFFTTITIFIGLLITIGRQKAPSLGSSNCR